MSYILLILGIIILIIVWYGVYLMISLLDDINVKLGYISNILDEGFSKLNNNKDKIDIINDEIDNKNKEKK